MKNWLQKSRLRVQNVLAPLAGHLTSAIPAAFLIVIVGNGIISLGIEGYGMGFYALGLVVELVWIIYVISKHEKR